MLGIKAVAHHIDCFNRIRRRHINHNMRQPGIAAGRSEPCVVIRVRYAVHVRTHCALRIASIGMKLG